MVKIFKNFREYIVKILLYATLLFLVLITFLWMLNGHSSLSENFFASAIEILITVCLIDGLLSIDRHRRMRALNKAEANGVKTLMSLRIMGITNAFGFKYSTDIDVASYSNAQMREHVNKFFEDHRYMKFLKDLENMEARLRPMLKKLDERVEKELSGTRESLKEVKPYADPEIIHWIGNFQPKIIAQFTIVNFMYESIYVHLPEKGHNDPKKDKDFWPFFKNHLYKDLVVTGEGKSDKESFETVIKGIFKLFLDIHEKAELNRLHYDI